jgi:hypothetical protein
MNVSEDFELLESLFVELDPLENGFGGVLLEVHRHGDRYVLLEVAPSRATSCSGSPRRTWNWSTRHLPANAAAPLADRVLYSFRRNPLSRAAERIWAWIE